MQSLIDYLVADQVGGWAFDPENTTPVRIQIEWRGRVVAEGVADIDRPDIESVLQRRKCGFLFDLSAVMGFSVNRALRDLQGFAEIHGDRYPIPLFEELAERLRAQEADAELRRVVEYLRQGGIFEVKVDPEGGISVTRVEIRVSLARDPASVSTTR